MNVMSSGLGKTYEPKDVEKRLYDFWESNGFFESNADHSEEAYTVVMPPPNITGRLHMGHALDNILQDILIRFKRMKGYNVLWVPGTDHASIATEAKIVQQMRKEGIKKEDIGREGFLKRAWEWKEKYGGFISDQVRKIGCSCDWTHERFTMDEGCNKAVSEFFVRLYEKGLIHRGERVINWCPKCLTSISDSEVNFDEKQGHFWYVKYKMYDSDEFVVVATTRPETIPGDTALAVHPEDDRFKHLIGKKVLLPIMDKEIPIIADEYIKMDFGTGVLKVTPAHSPNDFEIGLRHNLPIINIMDENAVLNDQAGKYKGLSRDEAREKIVSDLEELGSLIKTEDIKHNVGCCYRCSSAIEPRVSAQWFVKMEPLAKPAIDCVKRGDVKFIPERFSKIYYHWMENVKDWCISRQLWWGHRIPAWYCGDCGEITVSKEVPRECFKCKSENISQDEDVLDTWFSSALWPFSVLGWPDKTDELEYFFPTDTLVTGYDIIFFWVAKMIFSSLEMTGKIPFKNVFIHGIVRDSQGRKMSKSLGNGIDPIEIIEKYGADALRFALATGNSPGNDMRFSDEKVLSSRNFANKIWNAARFIHMNINGENIKNEVPAKLSDVDKWIISRFNKVTLEVTENIEKFELGLALQKLYDFIWDEFCDWYIEFSKINICDNPENSAENKQVLVWIMSNTLKLLHPFMPFITEEIWQSFPQSEKSAVVSKYPEYTDNFNFKDSENIVDRMIEIIKSIRNRRSEMNVPQNKKTSIYIDLLDGCLNFKEYENMIKKLSYSDNLQFGNNFNIKNCAVILTNFAKIYIPLNQLIDKESELKRMNKELEDAKKYLESSKLKLRNEEFMSKAPENVINNVKNTVSELENKIIKIEKELENLIKNS
jgi:valyl-tRNA synthetase